MEAVPKVSMVHFSLKQTAQKSSFAKLKQYIAEIYQEDAESYSKEIYALETLRSAAYNPPTDISGCNLVKRYYCQLHSIQNRFPIANDCTLVNFSWRDIYTSSVTQSTNVRHDMAVVLYNYGALHTQLGASVQRATEDEMKFACTHFQCAAWAFSTVRENYGLATNGDLAPELLIFMQQISLAQAQECILEKGLMDNRKPDTVAKITAQIIEYYNTAFVALLTGGDEGTICDIVGAKLFKEWKQYVQFKIQYLSCIRLLYQGQVSEGERKMGERVTLYQAAFERLEEARKEAKSLEIIQEINETLSFVAGVVEEKRKAAKNDNEYIYHEKVPELNTIPLIQGCNLVKGTGFNVADAEFAAEDIFHRLVPIKTHEASSVYSEEKANILRRINHKIEKKDKELNKFMDSLNIEFLNGDVQSTKLPQPLIDRCADLNAKPNAIPDLISKMSALAEICVDVESSLPTIKNLLSQEEQYEKDYEQTMGYRPNSHFIELNREYLKYHEAHNRAGESNDTLRKAMELHVNNLKTLSQPLTELQNAVPACNTDVNATNLQDARHLLNKVNEMRTQRSQLLAQLSDNIQKDDITSQLVAWGDKEVEKLFKTELAKHEQLIGIIEQNVVAQGNILKAFTDTYAKCAHNIKTIADTKHRRELFFSSLIASYDVYDDLLGKSLKGLEFYKKLQSNIHKLQSRVRAARDVHDEERQQRLDSIHKKSVSTTSAASTSQLPHINKVDIDTLPNLDSDRNFDHYHNVAIRPNPIGQENTAIPSTCVTSANDQFNNRSYIMQSNIKVEPNTMQYPFAPYQQNNSAISVPQIYSNTNYSVASSAVTPSMLSTNDSASVYSSQSISTSALGGTGALNSGTSGYLNPIYNSMQANIRSATPPQAQGQFQNYATTSQSSPQPTLRAALAQLANQAALPSQQMYNSQTFSPQAYGQNANSQPPSQQTYSQPAINIAAGNSLHHDSNYYSQSSQIASQPSYAFSSANTYPSNTMNAYYSGTSTSVPSQQYTDANTYYSKAVNPNLDIQPAYPPSSFNQLSPQSENTFSQSQIPFPSNEIGLQDQYSQMQTLNPYGVQSQLPTNQQSPYSMVQSNETNAIQNIQNNLYNQYGQANSCVVPTSNLDTSGYTTSLGGGYTTDYNQLNANQYYSGATATATPTIAGYGDTNSYIQGSNASTHGYNNTATSYYADSGYTTTIQHQQPQPPQQQQSHEQPQHQQQAQQPQPQMQQYIQPGNASVPPAKSKAKIDLLSDLDNLSISAPTLQPIKPEIKTEKDDSLNVAVPPTLIPENTSSVLNNNPLAGLDLSAPPSTNIDATNPIPISNTITTNNSNPITAITANTTVDTAVSIKTEFQFDDSNSELNLNSLSDSKLSLESNKSVVSMDTNQKTSTYLTTANIENFIKEVQRFEKSVNILTTKTLNGTTPLETKWKELHDLLDKDASKRSVTVSKLFPEKNRSMLHVPYDHARVLLPTETDNYINAAHVRDLGSQYSHFILADAPTFNTNKDFLCMIWSQNSPCVVCVSTLEEQTQNTFYPKNLNVEQIIGEFSVTVTSERTYSHAIERCVRITMCEINSTREFSIVHVKTWRSQNNLTNIVGISQNIIEVTNRQIQAGPIIFNCATNGERSNLVAIGLTAFQALRTKQPVIANVSDIWFRICSQRKGALNDLETYHLSMQIVLLCCREFLKMSSVNTPASQTNYYFIQEEKQEVKDPFKDLDPLWKLK